MTSLSETQNSKIFINLMSEIVTIVLNKLSTHNRIEVTNKTLLDRKIVSYVKHITHG